MKRIILHSFLCAGLVIFATSCSKEVKAPAKTVTNATSKTAPTTTTTTTTTTNTQDHGHCGGGGG